MAKFNVVYKYFREVDLGEIEAKTKKEVLKKAEEKLVKEVLFLKAVQSKPPVFEIKKKGKKNG